MLPVCDSCLCDICMCYLCACGEAGWCVCVGVKWLLSGLDKVWDGEGERKACVHVCGHNY